MRDKMKKYREFFRNHKKYGIIFSMFIIAFIGIILNLTIKGSILDSVFLILLGIQIRNSDRRYDQYKSQYNRTLGLLKKMKCMILEYDIKTRKVTTNALFEETFGNKITYDFFERIEEYKLIHPEFDFDGLVRELQYAIHNKVTTSFESIYCEDKLTYKMLSIVMMPILNEYGKVVNILGSVRENSAEHLELKEKVDMFNQIPGGTYRCYLRDPLHLDYVGQKFCKMLGYTVKEFENVIEKNYINIIVKEDQDIFRHFIREAAESPQVRTCQYRIICKDGKVLPVLDTMETIINDSGSMQGYSVVIDISEYVKRQNIVQQELKQLEQNLEMMRIKNSTSQMQPHFLYNALSSIREVILIDAQYASNMLYDFTVYLRACIQTMKNGDLISIQQEMENICAYVNIEKMRMGNRLNIIYDQKAEDFKIASLSIQPLVENAIRHGIYRRGKQGGTVRVTTESLFDCNMVTVEDDGVGFDYKKVRDEVARGERKSIGLDNVIFRLTKQLGANVVINSEIGVGTKVEIYIPRERKNNESSNT